MALGKRSIKINSVVVVVVVVVVLLLWVLIRGVSENASTDYP